MQLWKELLKSIHFQCFWLSKSQNWWSYGKLKKASPKFISNTEIFVLFFFFSIPRVYLNNEFIKHNPMNILRKRVPGLWYLWAWFWEDGVQFLSVLQMLSLDCFGIQYFDIYLFKLHHHISWCRAVQCNCWFIELILCMHAINHSWVDQSWWCLCLSCFLCVHNIGCKVGGIIFRKTFAKLADIVAM